MYNVILIKELWEIFVLYIKDLLMLLLDLRNEINNINY